MDVEASLESTPTWAVAAVCSVLILIALLIEHALHLLTLFFRRRKRKTLDQALYQIKAELRNLGFMSLLLTVAKQPISKICIPTSLAGSFHPCKDPELLSSFVEEQSCQEKGKISLLSIEGTQQLQMLIFVLAIFHVLSCLLTLGLGVAKMKRWESWEEETRSLEYVLSNDPRRFKLTRQTSFGRRHLKFWSRHHFLLWIVCFFRQFTDSVSKSDYFALRHGFITDHFAQDTKFNFHKFIRRSVDHDLMMVVKISFWIWVYAVFFILFSAHGFYNHFWLPFIPLVILLVVGTKLEVVITTMCLNSSHDAVIVPGTVCVKPDSNFFWFGQPQWLLHVIQFILIQNSIQLAFFTWTWYNFGVRSCFHKDIEDIVLSIGVGILVQFLCAYVTLPLYALVTQMGSSMKETIFTDRILESLKNWRNTAKKNLATKISAPSSPSSSKPMPSFQTETSSLDALSSPSSLKPMPSFRTEISSFDARVTRPPHFEYPSGRLELLEIQRVAEEMMECSATNTPYDGEISFGFWRKKDGETSSKSRVGK